MAIIRGFAVAGVVLSCAAVACGPRKQAQSAAPAPVATVSVPTRGGMWMPEQMGVHAPALKQLGLKLPPQVLTDVQASPLAAVVFLGGCSAAFVSPEGLILTNHHCAVSALQHNSAPQQDLLRAGYVAKGRTKEKSIGPTGRVFVTQKQTDVTQQMNVGLEAITDGRERFLEKERRSKHLVQACEAQVASVRCEVASFLGGARYQLIERLEIKDVRLVYAPPEGIGNFGGEIDNWQWPRHGGDFTFLRAYVAKDGSPAEYSPNNVPYQPKAHLKVATQPLNDGDLVFVAGYPAHTDQFATPIEIDELVQWQLPRQIRYCEENIAAIERSTQGDPAAALKAYPPLRGLHNRRKALQGALDGLGKGGAAQQKAQKFALFRAWVEKNERAQLAVLNDLQLELERRTVTRARRANLDEILQASTLLQGAIQIVRTAKEREKPDAERKVGFQERNLPMIQASLTSLDQRYAMKVDTARLMLALDRIATAPLAERPGAFSVLGGELVQPKARTKNTNGMFLGSTLPSKQARLKLLTADWKRIEKHWDPLLRVARELVPEIESQEAEDETFKGRVLLLRARYMALLQKFAGYPLAPDANRTLRVTYGTVRGYSPGPGKAEFPAFTQGRGIVSKHTGKEPFNAPQPLLEKIKARAFGPYADATTGDLLLNFVADLHITGGNSGSPTLDAQGNLVGVAFDGNYEAMASNWLFMTEITRSIHVDIRYILWLMDAVYPAHDLLTEMGVTPSL